MAIVPIVTVPDERLTRRSEKVEKIDDEIKNIVKDMLDTLNSAKDPEGAGLAAPQLGINKRIIIVKNFFEDPANPEKTLTQTFVLINPKIISSSKETVVDWEGCLSVPDKYGKVERFKKVKVKAMDLAGEEIRLTASGYSAAVIQHEIDHLDGILFTSKVIGETITQKEMDEIYA